MMMREDWIEVELGDMLDYIQPSKYIVESTEYSDNYKTPVLTAGKSFIIGYTNETENIFNDVPVIIFDDFTTATQFVNFHFKVKSSAMKILKPTSDLVNIRYVFYFMKTIRQNTDTHKRYWISIFSKIKIPIAPLPEQRAIAAKIEQLLSELDNGIANLKAAKSKLEIYRQAILKQAFEESINSVCFNLSEITNKIQIGPFGSQLHKEDYVEGGIPLINPMHIQDGQIYPSSSYSITIQKRDSLPNYILLKDDVIMGRRGEMGRCGLITKKEEGWFCGTGSLYLRPIKQKVYPVFLYYYLRSPIIKELLTGKATGTTMTNLNKTIISALPINLPSIEEQAQIVQEIQTRLSVCDKLNESIDQSLEKAQALRQSILKKAFKGKLLSEDELQNCRQQSDWETAAKLLERVKKDSKTKKS